MSKMVLRGRYLDKKGEVWIVTGTRPRMGRTLMRRESKPDDIPVGLSTAFCERAFTRITAKETTHMATITIALKDRANLSIPEAMAYTHLGRRAVDERIEKGRWQWFWEGSRKRIIRASIDADQLVAAAQAA